MYNNNFIKILATFSILVSLSACVTGPSTPADINSAEHQKKLASVQNWRIEGRLAYKSPDEKRSASLNWRQNVQHYQLNLSTVFGTSLLEMKGEPNHVVLEADDKQYQDTDPTRLIWRTTGWRIPLNHFPHWIKGQTSDTDRTLYSPEGWVQQIQSQCFACKDWLINYDKYKLVNGLEIDALWLPHKIVLVNATTNSQIIIRVNKWLNN
ncbi:MAG: outer membrane lipoprotein LolB [Paraglaciecola sp.]